jgi:hypothetical protein
LGDYFAYDSKLAKSLKPLMFKPGFLAKEYREGKRVAYISPLRLYIFISIFFFIVLNLSGSSRDTDPDSGIWDSFFHDYLPKVFFLFLPLFAGIQSVLLRKLKKGYVFHLVSALHFHSFLFLLLTVYLLISKLFMLLGIGSFNIYLLLLTIIAGCIYLFRSLQNTFGLQPGKTVLNFILLMLIYGLFVSGTLLLILGYITLQE